MATGYRFLPMFFLLVSTAWVNASEPGDSEDVRLVFEADQAARSPDRVKQGIIPSLQEEKNRRVRIFQLIAAGKVVTANDHVRALTVLHHTPFWQDDNGKPSSFSLENHIMAFFLALRAEELGHPSGLEFVVWTYNYYLRGAGCSMEEYGYGVIDGKIKANEPQISPLEREQDCGFDPEPHLAKFPGSP